MLAGQHWKVKFLRPRESGFQKGHTITMEAITHTLLSLEFRQPSGTGMKVNLAKSNKRSHETSDFVDMLYPIVKASQAVTQ